MIQLVSQSTLNQLNNGIIKFQSLYRGYIARKYTILPGPIINAVLCNQINAFIKLGRRQVTDVTLEIKEEKKFFIKWDKNQEALSLVFTSENLVGSGFWKKFFSANTIKISLANKKKEIKQFESVWIEVDSKTTNEIRIHELLYQQFIREMPKGVYFLEPLEQVYQNIYTQRRLINRLDKTKFNDPLQKAYCMRDIARGLTWIHQRGMVHGDVYLKNILVKEQIDDEGFLRLVSYLTDFGSTKIWGADRTRKFDDYVRWDCCKCLADINTPLMDWHGFIITNIVAWFPAMITDPKWEKFISTRQIVFQNEFSKTVVADASYWIGYKPFKDLNPLEQRAWDLFVAICKKSTQLYLYFKDSTDEISQEAVGKGMVEVNAVEVIKECVQFADEMCDWAKSTY